MPTPEPSILTLFIRAVNSFDVSKILARKDICDVVDMFMTEVDSKRGIKQHTRFTDDTVQQYIGFAINAGYLLRAGKMLVQIAKHIPETIQLKELRNATSTRKEAMKQRRKAFAELERQLAEHASD